MQDELKALADADANKEKNQSKEVWNKKDIRVKTELSDDQIKGLARLEFVAEKFGSETLGLFNITFMEMQKSRMRKSMMEFVESHKATMQAEPPGNNLMGWLNKPL